VAASASIIMRAYRVADSSFHTWRAGAYDPTMNDATGAQAPPFPTGDYSDHVVIGTLGGPLARSDAEAFLLPGMGTPGAPITFNIDSGPSTVEGTPGTDCRDYESISIWIVVTTVGTAATLNVGSAWSNVNVAAGGADVGVQYSDDAIVDGDSPQNAYRAIYSFSGLPGQALGPYNVPIRGRRHFAVVATDTGDLEGYVLAMRMA
jgi:hypothetical protein